MRLNFMAVLLSSTLVSFNYATDLLESSSTESLGLQQFVASKIVPDNFERAGEYRVRRAELESQLTSMQWKKLKEFTPEIFAGMLAEAVEIAKLGVKIYEKLPTIAPQVNAQFKLLETQIKSKNALISWRELKKLIENVDGFPFDYWSEFLFDFESKISSANLQPQVISAHQYALSESETWRSIKENLSNTSFPWDLISEYSNISELCRNLIDQLIENKFNEEREDTIAQAGEIFRKKLSLQNITFVYDLSKDMHYSSSPRMMVERNLELIIKGKQYKDINRYMFNNSDFVVHRDLMAEFVSDISTISEWVGFNEYSESLLETRFYEERLITYSPMPLKDEVEMKGAYLKKVAWLEKSIQTALDETFEWLMTQ